MGDIGNAYKTLSQKPESMRPVEGVLEICGWVKLKCILKKQNLGVWTGLNWLRFRNRREIY
jgi:hypothetical protein